jgi:hypothetical protein
MDFVENLRVGEEGAETGFGAKVDRPATILDSREVCRIGVAKDAPAQGNEAWIFLLFERFEPHTFIISVQLPPGRLQKD